MVATVLVDGQVWWRDNPVTWHPDPADWLAGNRYTPTASFRRVMVSPLRLRALPGRNNEHLFEDRAMERAITDRLASSMQRNGWLESSVPLVCVEQDGTPYIYEGNHRILAAADIGLDAIPVEVRYLGGSEMVPNVWTPLEGMKLPV